MEDFEPLYERYWRLRQSFVHLRIRVQADTEEIVQEASIGAFRPVDRDCGSSSLPCWNHAIADPVMIDHAPLLTLAVAAATGARA